MNIRKDPINREQNIYSLTTINLSLNKSFLAQIYIFFFSRFSTAFPGFEIQQVFIVSLRKIPSLVAADQPNDSDFSTADKLSRVLRARRDVEADPQHPDTLV